MRMGKRIARDAAADLALNREVQGGGICHISGFPSRGHAHQYNERPPNKGLSARGYSQLANTSG